MTEMHPVSRFLLDLALYGELTAGFEHRDGVVTMIPPGWVPVGATEDPRAIPPSQPDPQQRSLAEVVASTLRPNGIEFAPWP